MRKLNYYWRVLATGISFSTFGLGSLVLGAIWFRLLACIEHDPAELERRTQRGVSLTFNAFLRLMTVLGVARFHYRDMQNLTMAPSADVKGRLIIANHPTLIDVIALISRMPNVQCIVKHELFSNFFISPAVSGANYIRNDEDPEKLAQDCIDAINSGKSIVVFPRRHTNTCQQCHEVPPWVRRCRLRNAMRDRPDHNHRQPPDVDERSAVVPCATRTSLDDADRVAHCINQRSV